MSFALQILFLLSASALFNTFGHFSVNRGISVGVYSNFSTYVLSSGVVFVSVRTQETYNVEAVEFTERTKRCYATKNGYSMYTLTKEPDVGDVVRLPWGFERLHSKISHFRKIVAIGEVWDKYDVFVFTDTDVVVGNTTFELEGFLEGGEDIVFNKNALHGVNAGVFILRKSARSLAFLKEWWSYRYAKMPHSDQGALYDVLLKKALPQGSYVYKGECGVRSTFELARRFVLGNRRWWGHQTGCFNKCMHKLGYVYPNWPDLSSEGILLSEELQGFPLEEYVDRSEAKYKSLGYEPFNYKEDIGSIGYTGDRLFLHGKQLKKSVLQSWTCSEGLAKDSFVNFKGRHIFSILA